MKGWTTGHLIIFVLALVVVGFGWLLYLNTQEISKLEQLLNQPADVPVAPKPEPVPTENPHETEIKQIESDAGMPLSRIAQLIIKDEGDRSRPYLDTSGAPTIGVGRNLKGNGLSVSELKAIAGEIDYDLLLREAHIQNGRVHIKTLALANEVFVKPLTEHDIQLLLTDDLKSAQDDAVSVFGAGLWGSIAEARREAILDTVFNLGLPHFKEFVNFIGAVKRKDWKTAASELLLSDAARKNIIRYHNNARILLEGKL